MKIHIGGTLEGIYWTSGVVDNIVKNDIDLEIYSTGASSLIAIFFSIYKKNFFAKLKSFVNDKDNPLQNLLNYTDMYKNRYSQATTLIKLGRSKDALYKHEDLKSYLEDNFDGLKISDLKENVHFELFNITEENPEILSRDTKIVDLLLAQFSYPPFYKYYEINERKYIPTSYLSYIPWINIENSIIINFDMKIKYPKPQNGLEILLNASHNRTKKLFELLTENNNILIPDKISDEPLMISSFFQGQKESRKILGDYNE